MFNFSNNLNTILPFLNNSFLFLLYVLIMFAYSRDLMLEWVNVLSSGPLTNPYSLSGVGYFKASLILGVFYTAFIIFFINNNFLNNHSKYIIATYAVIVVCSSILFITEDILTFFMMYEAVLIPSALLVFFMSPNRSSYVVSLYFLLWTQLGSFMVLVAVTIIQVRYGVYNFSNLTLMLPYNTPIVSYLLLIGFGINIPLWPFHFWLTNTHVEANTSFSIFLSGILVNTALAGLYKFNLVLIDYSHLLFAVTIVSLTDVTFKLSFQTDFNNLTAYLTVQEMGMLVLFSLFITPGNNPLFFNFVLLHTLLSGALFFSSETFYLSNGTSQISMLSGVLVNNPTLSSLFYSVLIFFIGIPLTLNFFIEIAILMKFLSYNMVVLSMFAIFIQVVTILFFFKSTVSYLFLNVFDTSQDLNSSEATIFIMNMFPMIFLPFM